MRPSHACYTLISQFEGFSSRIYRCPAGYDTVGYGHRVRMGECYGGGITHEEAYDLLRRDAAIAADAVHRLIHATLNQSQYDALVSFTFNVGAGALQRSTLRQVLLRGEMARAPDEFRRWVFAGGRKLSGLVQRREAEIATFRRVV
jgi:lysozyme